MSKDERRSLVSSGGFSIKKGFDEIENDDDEKAEEIEDIPVCCSYRIGVIICCTLSMTISYAAQASLSSAMVCMMENKADYHEHFGPSINLGGGADNGTINAFNVTAANGTGGHNKDWLFGWDKTQQGLAMSTFFMGYYIAQVPAGIAAAIFGPKRVIVVSLILVSIFQGLAVPAAYFGIGWLYADRILVGIIDGFLYAPTFALAGKWAPRQETSLLFGIVGIGMELGNVLSYATSLLACEIVVQEGWPFVFYIMAGLGLIIAVLFMVIVSDSPFRNSHISRKEVKFIAASMPKRQPSPDEALYRIPMKEILKSPCVWAIVVSQIGSDWLYYFFVTMEPTFLEDVIKLTYAEVNLLSGLPFLGIIPTIYLSGYLCDRLVTKGVISNTNIRKINDFICKIVPSAILVGLGFLPQDSTALAFVLNLVGAMCMGFSYVSWMANPVDLAPAYTGFIVGICEIGAIWVAIAVPIVFDVITVNRTREEWQLVFYITAGIQVFCFLFYAIFASGELQPWAFSTTNREVYDNLDGPVDVEKRLLDEEFHQSKSYSKHLSGSMRRHKSMESTKRNSSAESDAHNLISSLSLSLGKFRGTTSYEAALKSDPDRGRQQDGVRSSTLVISGPAHISTSLLSAHITSNTDFNSYNMKNGGMASHANSGNNTSADFLQPPRIISSSEIGAMETKFGSEMYIESDDDSWHNTATKSLPAKLTAYVFHGHGDHDIWSAVSSGQFSDAGHSDSSRNVKSLATEIAEALSVHSLHEKMEEAKTPKISGSPVKRGRLRYYGNISNFAKSINGKDKDLSKWNGLIKNPNQAIMNIDDNKTNDVSNDKANDEISGRQIENKYLNTNRKNAPNSGNSSSIMVPSEELVDSVDASVSNKHDNNKDNFRGRKHNKGKSKQKSSHKDPKQVPGLVKRLFTFGRSKSNPDFSTLPDEETFVFVTDEDVQEALMPSFLTRKSFDSARTHSTENTNQAKSLSMSLAHERGSKKSHDESHEDGERVIFEYPHNPRKKDKQ